MSMRPPAGLHPLSVAMQMLDDALGYIDSEGTPVTLARHTDNGDLVPMSLPEARLYFGTLRYLDKRGEEQSALGRWLTKETSGKKYLRLVFKSTAVAPDEHNLFLGFSVNPSPSKAIDLARPFLRHCYRMICGSNREKFRYLMRWLAHMVQNIGSNPETALILISETEGAGKSIIGRIFEHILGKTHTNTVGSPLALYDNKNAFSRRWILVVADDIKDMKHSDAPKLRGYLTDTRRRIEEKFVPVTYVPNCLHLVITSNSDTPIPLGLGSRRYVIFRVKEDHIGDFEYFGRIEDGIANGGAAQLLRFLLNMKLGKWHPRQLPGISDEIVASQIESVSPVIRWLMASRDLGGIASADAGSLQIDEDLGFDQENLFAPLYSAYASWAKVVGEKLVSTNMAGRILKKLLGLTSYKPQMLKPDGTRGRGYAFPTVDEFDLRIEAMFDPSKRKDLEQRCFALRAVSSSQAAAPNSAGRPFVPHRASPCALALMAAWPKNSGSRSLSYADMVKLSKKDPAMKMALHDIASACADAYDSELDEANLAQVIRAFAGAHNGSQSFSIDPNTGNLFLIPAREVQVDERDMPIGIKLQPDGTLWDVVLNTPYEEAGV